MAALITLLIYLSFIFTPLGGFVVLQLLLRAGWFTAGTTERKSPFLSATSEYFEFKSRVHRWAALGGFFLGWMVTLGLYIRLLDVFYFQGS